MKRGLNNPLFDIVATNSDGSKTVSIQVKTRSIHNQQGWKLGKEITRKKNNPHLFIILVNLEEDYPDFYIYEYDRLAEIVEANYREYMSTPKRDGSRRKEVPFRWHDIKNFTEEDRSRKNRWDLIEKELV